MTSDAFMSGTQALVRLIEDQLAADRRAGLDTGAMVSGYPGSPLGGFDQELARNTPEGVVHRPGQNEELGATAVWGSQLVPSLPNPRKAGVLGVWYGKAPGVDRAADAFRHGNFVGAHPEGGLIALCGDDPTCKSSTLPSATESTLAALGMPVIYPGTVQELLDLGRHAIAASRASGLWVAIKAVANVVDGTATVTLDPDRVKPVMPEVMWQGKPYRHTPDATLLTPYSLDMERTLVGPRLELARAYARDNNLNQITVPAPEAAIGVIAAGTAYYDVREAFGKLGLTDEVRLLKIGMLWPLEPTVVQEFARGLSEIIVVEEKAPLLEGLVKDVLYGTPNPPAVTGKAVIPQHGGVDADLVARVLADRLSIDLPRQREPLKLLGPTRTPFFCSGCPHNRSTAVPEGSVVAAGIGCHTMVVLNPAGKGDLTGLTQMGGEGAQWIGQAPFTGTRHIFQNLGDGTFHHSGSLAIRAAVGAGVNITYKLLYNSAVAMTGGQTITPALSVASLTHWLELEGVRKVIVTTDDLSRYKGVRLSPIASLRERADLEQAQSELAAIEGVTVLVHDQQCAAEKRRLRKKGDLPDPVKRVAINQRVCEGCGDCGQKSECLSVLPVETEFGRKTEIHQSSCNKDYSCLEGDCPSFLTIIPGTKKRSAVPTPPEMPVPDLHAKDTTIRLVGIGGTGVVSVARLLGKAALMDGRQSRGLDQTGLAQKGGTVVSDIRLFDGEEDRSGQASAASVDAYLALDVIGATDPKHLRTTSPSRTVAVVSTHLSPTGGMVLDPATHVTDLGPQLTALEARARSVVALNAERLAQALFGDHMQANTIVLGAAWQLGLIPLSLTSMEKALGKSATAFHWGRAVIAAPSAVDALFPATSAPEPSAEVLRQIAFAGEGSELHKLLAVRVPDLVAYQNPRYAQRYLAAVREVHALAPGAVAEAYATHLHRLMAYKDEYEVARLHLDPAERARIAAEFGPGTRVAYNLHPPVLRALGLKRKLSLGPWFDPAFKALYGMRTLRGTKLDVFGVGEVRRAERSLAAEYTRDVLRALSSGAPEEKVLQLAQLPDVIRGYEHVKLRGVADYRERAAALLESTG
ncbi:indolepyruvate ferredoxin oxidoreductase family protein [Nonomuraea sp. NPDC059194]|uniref:indolepyruvate ferredoxin oxidoreductase family protein n=1 Tax=Nonomuraea sp. NPDC059194 TaxID=3346764 RepID=UPI0036B911DA